MKERTKFIFELDAVGGQGRQEVTGAVATVSASPPSGEFVEEVSGAFMHKQQHLGKVEAKDISFEVDMGAADNAVVQWICSAWNSELVQRNGALTFAQEWGNGGGATELNFYGALPTSVTLPALDTSKDGFALVNVSIQPEWVETKGVATFNTGSKNFDGVRDKLRPSKSRFALYLDKKSLQKSCLEVQSVDSLKLGVKLDKVFYGADRNPHLVPTALEVPELSFKLPLKDAQPFVNLHSNMFEKGVDTNVAMTGALVFQNGRSVPVFAAGFQGLRLKELTFDKADGKDPSVSITMTIESLKLGTPSDIASESGNLFDPTMKGRKPGFG